MPRLTSEERTRRQAARARKKRAPPGYYCPRCAAPVTYKGFYECEAGCGTVEMRDLVPQSRLQALITSLTSTDAPPLVGWGKDTTQEDPMPSHASKAAQAAAKDREGRPNLTVVPDPNPGKTKGDAARAAIVAELPEYQQAEYARLTAPPPAGEGMRHVTALATARKLPDPSAETGDIDKQAADLFAAFQAGQVAGAAGPAETLAATVNPPAPKPETPKPPKQSTPKQTPKPKPAPPAPADGTGYRYIGTVTSAILGVGGTAEDLVADCRHAATNGHMTTDAAVKCAAKLLGKYPGGITGTRPHPVRRDLSGRRLS